MAYLEELRRRVESAEQQFERINELNRQQSDRVAVLLKATEERVREKQVEIQRAETRIGTLEAEKSRLHESLAKSEAATADLEAANKALSKRAAKADDLALVAEENEQLRRLLHSLLLAVESRQDQQIGHTLQDLDSRLTALSMQEETAKNGAADTSTEAKKKTDAAVSAPQTANGSDSKVKDRAQDKPAAATGAADSRLSVADLTPAKPQPSTKVEPRDSADAAAAAAAADIHELEAEEEDALAAVVRTLGNGEGEAGKTDTGPVHASGAMDAHAVRDPDGRNAMRNLVQRMRGSSRG